MYWPNMSNDITSYARNCMTCAEFSDAQQKQPLQTSIVKTMESNSRRSILFNKKHYMITVDYYSDYFEIDRLYCTTTSGIVKKLKGHFARHGIPDEVMTDNGPNLVSDNFAKFAESRNFLHATSSPYHSRSNGKPAAAVKIAKTLLRKVKRSKLDFYEALLGWRNKPTEGVNASPSQRIFSQHTKTKLLTTEKLLVPNVSRHVSDSITRKRQLAKHYHDKKSKNLPALEGNPFMCDTNPLRKEHLGIQEQLNTYLTIEVILCQQMVMTQGEMVLIFENEHVLMGR